MVPFIWDPREGLSKTSFPPIMSQQAMGPRTPETPVNHFCYCYCPVLAMMLTPWNPSHDPIQEMRWHALLHTDLGVIDWGTVGALGLLGVSQEDSVSSGNISSENHHFCTGDIDCPSGRPHNLNVIPTFPAGYHFPGMGSRGEA